MYISRILNIWKRITKTGRWLSFQRPCEKNKMSLPTGKKRKKMSLPCLFAVVLAGGCDVRSR